MISSKDEQLLKRLEAIILEKPLVICIGNELRGDDAAGIIFGQNLQKMGYSDTLLVFDTPENYLQKIISIPTGCRLWVDVMNWGAIPGSFTILNPNEVQHFAISTHNYSPVVLQEFLKNYRDIPDYFLGVQPLDISLGNKLSEPVSAIIKHLTDFFIRTVQNRK
jgi:hydrogenase 3 maturation protease